MGATAANRHFGISEKILSPFDRGDHFLPRIVKDAVALVATNSPEDPNVPEKAKSQNSGAGAGLTSREGLRKGRSRGLTSREG